MKAAALGEVGEEGVEDGMPSTGDLPAMIPLVNSLPGGGGGGQVVPGEAMGELEEDELWQFSRLWLF